MSNKKTTISNRTFVGSYLIKKVFLTTKDTIIYLVEDMKIGQEFLLTEFYPRAIVSREEGEIVFTIHQPNIFKKLKKKFVDEATQYYADIDLSVMNTISTFYDNETVYSVTTYREEQTLKHYIQNKNLNDRDIVTLFQPLLMTLNKLHSQGIIFKHLHLDNLFVNKKGIVLASHLSNQLEGFYVPYSPLEQCSSINENSLTTKSDMYALGAILYELVKGVKPVGATERKEKVNNFSVDPLEPLNPEKGLGKEFCEFVNDALSLELYDRPSTTAKLQSFCISSHQLHKSDISTKDVNSREIFSGLRLAGIFLIGIAISGFVMQNHEKKVSIHELSYLTIVQYKWAAFLGDEKAQNALGMVYENGIKVEQNLNTAIEWYKKSADNGNVTALKSLARLSDNKANSKIPGHLEQFSKINNYETSIERINLAYYYFTEKKYKTSYEMFKKLADENNVYSMMFVGYMYTKGYGVKKDFYVAATWLEKAMEKGNGYASYYLANLYLRGQGVPKNDSKALTLYRKSAEKGVARGMIEVGKNYLNQAKKKNGYRRIELLENARNWFTKAEKAGSPLAKKYLKKIIKLENKQG